MKTCSRCKEDKSVTEFSSSKDVHGKVRLTSACKECLRVKARERYANNREVLIKRSTEWKRKRRLEGKLPSKVLTEEERLEKTQQAVDRKNARVRQWRKNRMMDIHSDAYRKTMFDASKNRAKRKGIEHTISLEDIFIPTHCPLLGIALKKVAVHATGESPSLDRIDNSKGYIPGNVWVISNKANTMKGSATLEDLELLIDNLRKKLKEET